METETIQWLHKINAITNKEFWSCNEWNYAKVASWAEDDCPRMNQQMVNLEFEVESLNKVQSLCPVEIDLTNAENLLNSEWLNSKVAIRNTIQYKIYHLTKYRKYTRTSSITQSATNNKHKSIPQTFPHDSMAMITPKGLCERQNLPELKNRICSGKLTFC